MIEKWTPDVLTNILPGIGIFFWAKCQKFRTFFEYLMNNLSILQWIHIDWAKIRSIKTRTHAFWRFLPFSVLGGGAGVLHGGFDLLGHLERSADGGASDFDAEPSLHFLRQTAQAPVRVRLLHHHHKMPHFQSQVIPTRAFYYRIRKLRIQIIHDELVHYFLVISNNVNRIQFL